VSVGRLPLFCDIALAGRIERAEAQLVAAASEAARRRMAAAAGFVLPIAGGVASFAEEGSPFNKVAGLGFGGVPNAAALEEIERAFTACGAPVQIELAHLADPAIGALLTRRGYRLASFENVLGLALTGEHDRVTPAGIEVRPSGDDELETWLGVVVDAGLHPDTQGVPSHEEFPRAVLARAERDLVTASGVMRYAALRDGVIAGGASFRTAEGIAQSPARRPRPHTGAGVSRPRCCRPGSPTRLPSAATSPSSVRSRGPSLSRTCSAGGSTCSTPGPYWSNSPEPAAPADAARPSEIAGKHGRPDKDALRPGNVTNHVDPGQTR
jgi:hypothetical protein